MEATSIIYIVIALISVFIFYSLKSNSQTLFLVLLSCGFIATYSHSLLIYVLFYTAINYFIALQIPLSPHGKALYRIGIVVNITQLIVLRYSSFAIDPLFQLFNSDIHVSGISKWIIPIGISYFSLQGIGYLINVKMRWERPEKNFLTFLLYISFAPKFISGPIERSNHFIPQLKQYSPFRSENISAGLRIALIGFFKKVVIANHLAPTVTTIYATPELYSGGYFWLLVIIQPLYLYFDFSGYTDIAIGVARMFGINLLPNFNRPFLAGNVTTFWKRFHISLASWFNDYVFKQTSFRLRKWKKASTIIALLLAWTLFGIWHGAGWNFMILGLLQATAIIFEFYTKKFRAGLFKRIPDMISILISRLITFIFYGVSLTFFFSPDFKTTQFVFASLVKPFHLLQGELLAGPLSFGLALAVIMLLIEVVQEDYNHFYSKVEILWNRYQFIRFSAYFFLGFFILSQLGGTGVFVYQMF
jgi:D-alanyl-lipoteichoic acid acyltransferase DltB (MBOAT superfamily)